ncbi:MAG: hypothetical protein AAGD00_01685 [Planctomycetota bacterium]
MLIKVTDTKNREFFINPLYVKALREKKPGLVEISGVTTQWGTALVVQEDMQALADRLSVAMPDSPAMSAVLAAIRDQEEQAAAAAAAAG